jgi:multiple sugar transport system permease protein/N,N'-diacetylchitobiose transport system permease protein
VAVAMIAPATLVILAITVVPLLRAMWMSLFHIVLIRPGVEPFVGLGNYIAELTSPIFWGAMGRTFVLTVSSAGVSLALGLGLGVLMNQPLRGRWLLRSVIILPWALPGVVNAFMWQWIDHAQYGALNALLTQVHLLDTYQNWLGDPGTALWMIVIADIWKNTPLVALLVLAALQTVPKELADAAEVDGADALQVFRRVTLPLIMPMLLVALVLRTIDSIKLFNTIYVMTGGGPANATQTISLYAYKTAFQVFDFGKGATLGWLIAFVTVGFVIVYLLLIRGSARENRP